MVDNYEREESKRDDCSELTDDLVGVSAAYIRLIIGLDKDPSVKREYLEDLHSSHKASLGGDNSKLIALIGSLHEDFLILTNRNSSVRGS
ncbi:hypothetical protein COU61_01755 [Candidatus Pacearchaeota archaeon CG10_big_fil_rev_8_21_14_0_10_35_13]|nr:MAG: hypothetical protein COU61_01755 [Candidatus Pacearchaeota archaeon CG10_big_fil_rev_8_21_14_0_10_35_13]